MGNGQTYPLMKINLAHMRENAERIVDICEKKGISVTGVVKGADSFEHGYSEIADLMTESGCISVGDSRMNTIARMREQGFKGKVMFLRIPMKSELEDLVRLTDISLQSEQEILSLTNECALRENKVHEVMLMIDLGDLREGFFEEEELVEQALYVEYECKGLYLAGIGTNLGCYGGICPDERNLGRLVSIARRVEETIGRKLDIVSGGQTFTLPLVLDGRIPEGINHIRLGEAIVLSRDLSEDWNCNIDDMHQDVYTIQAEVIEVKRKASHPIGKIFMDAFGHTPKFEDRGIRKRALLALGRRDIGSFDYVKVRLQGAEILGGSSDHLILDIEEVEQEINVGDVISFDCRYGAMVFANQSDSVAKKYVR